jgi:L-cysteine S-thiosulfotransferase
MHRILLILSFCTLGLVSCGKPEQNPITTLVGSAESGKILFEQGLKNVQACSSCHAADDVAEVGPSLKGIAKRAGTRVGGQSADEYLRQAIVRPDAYIVPGYSAGLMPKDYGSALTAQQIQDLIAYMQTRD